MGVSKWARGRHQEPSKGVGVQGEGGGQDGKLARVGQVRVGRQHAEQYQSVKLSKLSNSAGSSIPP